MTYDANELNERLLAAFQKRHPNFRAMRFIFSSEPGAGKSTLLASTPVPQDTVRLAMDNEDSMAYVDAGENGKDVYTPRTQQFAMKRTVFPDVTDYAVAYQKIKKYPDKIGALLIDNAAILQDMIVSFLSENAGNPKVIRDVYKKMDIESSLPNNGLIGTWSRNKDGLFWSVCKAFPKALALVCMKNGIHFLVSTEEGNVWHNYGKADAKIIGKKAKIWDAWYRYTDAVISLKRDLNTTNPPFGELYPNQPKMRLQGFNPKFVMDWPGFVEEVEKAAERTSADIPENAQVQVEETFEEA